jgi:hypothetical protein
MARVLPLLTAIPLVLATGMAEGLWTNRWVTSQALNEATARLDTVPLSAGDWEGQAEQLDERQASRAEFTGYLLRHYVHRRTKGSVSVLIACGRPGPIAMHTPDICYAGLGYELVAPTQPRVVEVPGLSRPAEFEVGHFQRPGLAGPEQLALFWAWSSTGEWLAPAHPRLAFAREPALYKAYVICQEVGVGPGEAAGRDFIRAFFPQLNQSLFPHR